MGSIYTMPGIAGRAVRYARRLVRDALGWAARMDARRRLRRPGARKSHRLPGELIVSLTSYPPRFGTLHLTLGCLLDQSISADRTILWIAHQDVALLPTAVLDLERLGLEIRTCDDLRSFKKLVPTLAAFPDAFIVTADDDIHYPRRWLEQLAAGWAPSVVTCHRAHRMKRFSNGRLRPYLEWEFDVQDKAAKEPSIDLVPTGVGGILYPPGCLNPQVTQPGTFQRLCPDGDDLWFFWCARMKGTRHKKTGGRFRAMPWPGSQGSALWNSNEAGGNDRMIKALIDEYGVETLEL